MKSGSLNNPSRNSEVGVFDCEIHLRFRLVEELDVIRDREHLLDLLLDAFTCGADDFLEPIEVKVETQAVPEIEASPQMRRQLIRLRNSNQ
jgi:hypothetical protein